MFDSVSDRIDDYLDSIFASHDDIPAVADLRIEVRHDLFERLEDLAARGVDGDEAYDQVISSIGDLESTIAEMVTEHQATGRTRSAEPTAGFQPSGGVNPSESEPIRLDSADGPDSAEPSSGAETHEDAYRFIEPDGESPRESNPPGAVYTPLDEPPSQEATSSSFAEGIREQAENLAQSFSQQVVDFLAQVGIQIGDDVQRKFKRRPRYYTAAELQGVSFVGQDLARVKFDMSELRGADFSQAKLAESVFSACNLRNAIFDHADLTSAALKMSSLRDAHLNHTVLSMANLEMSDLRGVRLLACDLTGVRMKYADLRGCCFVDCRMSGIDFAYADLRDAVLDGIGLSKIRFDYANLARASFVGATLVDVSFRYVSRKGLAQADFTNARMDSTSYTSLLSTGFRPAHQIDLID